MLPSTTESRCKYIHFPGLHSPGRLNHGNAPGLRGEYGSPGPPRVNQICPGLLSLVIPEIVFNAAYKLLVFPVASVIPWCLLNRQLDILSCYFVIPETIQQFNEHRFMLPVDLFNGGSCSRSLIKRIWIPPNRWVFLRILRSTWSMASRMSPLRH